MYLRNLLLPSACAVAALFANAQAGSQPQFIDPAPGETFIVTALSDNGKWGLSENGSVTDGDLRPIGGTLLNIETLERIPISHVSGLVGVSDVTDDGSKVFGEFAGGPGFWTRSTDAWTSLPLPSNHDLGRVNAATPDGKFAVGYATPSADPYKATPVMWNAETGAIVSLANLPVLDMSHENKGQTVFFAISPDGRYVLGCTSMSYLMPRSMFSFVYDVTTQSYKVIGFTEHEQRDWTPKAEGLYFCDSPKMSPDGHWVTGDAYMVKEVPGSEWPNEYHATYRYNVLTDEFEVYDGVSDNDMAGFAVANDGDVVSVSPAVNPYSNAYVRKGKYFYGFAQIFSQAYGIDFEAVTGFPITGKPLAVSADGLTYAMYPTQDACYILKLGEPIGSMAEKIDLLGQYTATPASGSVMTSISTIDLKFTRPISAIGDVATIKLIDHNGNELRSALRVSEDGNTATIAFRTTAIQEGKTYSVEIPDGMFCIAGDRDMRSRKIVITYTGRSEGAVKPISIYPADGAAVARLDLSSNPVIVTFDAAVKSTGENALAKLCRAGEEQPFCDMYIATSENRMMVYPIAAQNLFENVNYTVVIPAGVVTDLSGNGPNEEITLNYEGTYRRQINPDEKFLFSEDCNSYDNFMFYEGDHRTPSSIPTAWGFDADNTPWKVIRDNETSADMAFGSHSMYTPSGKSDDWVVIPQLNIPDKNCFLSFQSQSYIAGANDSLKVIVLASDAVYNVLDSNAINEFRKNGVVVYSELQTPGATQEGLADEWTDNVVPLADFAGKNIYIAFLNDNSDASAVFIDNIQVIHDMKILTVFTNATRVVNSSEIAISGTVINGSQIDSYASTVLTLRNSEGDVVDVIEDTNIDLKPLSNYYFTFATPLPLEVGVANDFSVALTLDGEEQTLAKGSVKNLAFQPVRKVVLEEYSGAGCGNCPLGLLAIENIRNSYGNEFIAMCIRTYQGDPLSSGMGAYSQWLNLDAAGAPSGRINRGEVAYPMIQSDNRYLFSGAGIPNALTGRDEMCWLDLVQQELAEPVESEITFATNYDQASGKIKIDCSVRSAINLERQNLNLMAVILENGLLSYQSNYLCKVDDPNLGQYGAGGAYATSTIFPFTANDVVRGYWGTTFNGTGGLVPQSLECGKTYNATIDMQMPSCVAEPANCEVVVMMIDANTDRIVNANIAHLGSTTGIESVSAEAAPSVLLSLAGSAVVAEAQGSVALEVYSVAGGRLAFVQGEGRVEADLAGVRGMVIAKATAPDGSVVRKFFVK